MAKILLVEDNEMNRDMLSRRLLRKGYEVVMAVDGEQAVAMAQSEKPDLILMDLSLPGLDGWEATRILKSDPSTSHLMVVALSAHALAAEGERARAAGCDGFIAKPCLPHELVEQMAEYLKPRVEPATRGRRPRARRS